MPATLAETLVDHRVEFEELHRRYGPVLNMVDVLIGVVPNCDPYLEIWQPGFRTYNLMVPNFLNLPVMLVGRGAPKDLVGLSMYVSSRAADCMYCSAHTCSFALRRGSSADAVTGRARTDAEAATVAAAEGLSFMPHAWDPKLRDALVAELGAADADWVAMGAAMMGFLNKFMDALGVELEPEAVGDVSDLIGDTGWSVGQHNWDDPDLAASRGDGEVPTDSLGTYLKVGRNARGAIKLDKLWTSPVPKQAADIRAHVAGLGLDEPLLTAMMHDKPRRALGAMLHHNLDPDQSEIGIGTKALVGMVFAGHAANQALMERSRALAANHGIDDTVIEAVARWASDLAAGPTAGTDDLGVAVDDTTAAALTVARATAPSPAAVGDSTIEAATASLTPAQRVEVVVWVSVCQLLHRLDLWYAMAA